MSLSRRQFLKGSLAAGVAATWTPLDRLISTAQAATNVPPNFPPNIELFKQRFQNWSGGIQIDALWTCAPKTEQAFVDVVNWAAANGFRARPRGNSHNWSPLTVSKNDSENTNVVLMDTSALNQISFGQAHGVRTVTAGTGAWMDDLLLALENENLSITSHPAPGDLTVGGVLAIGGHGAAVLAKGEQQLPGQGFGSVSNLVFSLRAIVYEESLNRYVVKTYTRENPEIGPLLVHCGRAFITEATLQCAPLIPLACESITHHPITTLFPKQGTWHTPWTYQEYLEKYGRIETIQFPFDNFPWLKVWKVSPNKPFGYREVNQPYNYPFSDQVSDEQREIIHNIINKTPGLTPLVGFGAAATVNTGLDGTMTRRIWGKPKNTSLYIRPTTLRATANGYAIHCERQHVQIVVSELTRFVNLTMKRYKRQGKFPINTATEIRVNGLDHASDCVYPNAVEATLSALRPYPDHPEWDTAVWFDILTVTNTPDNVAFYREMEKWLYEQADAGHVGIRAEWSKGFAYSEDAGWDDSDVIDDRIPDTFRGDYPYESTWDSALAQYKRMDPARVFTSPFLDRLMPV